jgi:DNA-binding transcriptional MerR regulator
MRVQGMARQLGISGEWLKQLERIGVFPPAARDVNGHRRYVQEDVDRLRWLLVCQQNRRARARQVERAAQARRRRRERERAVSPPHEAVERLLMELPPHDAA